MQTRTFTLSPRGEFSLAQSSRFLSGVEPLTRGDRADRDPERLQLGLVLDRTWEPVAVTARQGDAGDVTVTFSGDAEAQHVCDGVERVLSLDVDASPLSDAVNGDPVATELLRRFPGLRPVCFASPYEAAAWAVLSQRIQMTQAARIRQRMCDGLGTTIDLGGVSVSTFPAPERLLRTPSIRGLPRVKVDRLHGLARAALDGRLDAAALRAAGPQQALSDLQRLPGIGPFGAELVLVRGAGEEDHFARSERRLHAAMGEAYGVDAADVDALEAIAASWSPFRSWIGFLFRTRASLAVE